MFDGDPALGGRIEVLRLKRELDLMRTANDSAKRKLPDGIAPAVD